MSEVPSSADVIDLGAYRELGVIGSDTVEEVKSQQPADVIDLAEWRAARGRVVDARPALIARVLAEGAIEASGAVDASSPFEAEEISHMARRSAMRKLANRTDAWGNK